jgi:hypothetical protein
MADTSFALTRTVAPASPVLFQTELDSARAYAEQEKTKRQKARQESVTA